MSDGAGLCEALLWTAGNEASAFRLRPEHHRAFLDAVYRHRLSGRLVRRLRGKAPRAARALAGDATRLHDTARAEAQKKIELAGRLGGAMRAAGRDDHLVLLKGFTLFALTGDPLTLRPMGDLDVSAHDLDGFVEVAGREGFQAVRPLNHLAEYAVLHAPRDGFVELHSRFDVTNLPADVRREDLDPGLHGGRWEQRRHFRVRYLRHADFQAHLGASSVVPDTIRPLRPEMAALVHAAHMFKNFLRCPHPLPVATIPLDEIATFADLCRLPAFEAARFARLVEDADGHTAVDFARALAHELLGTDPLPGDRGSDVFPANLWWDGLDGGGFPVDAGWDPRQLVYRRRHMRELVETLGCTELSLCRPGYRASFRLLDGSSAADAERYVFRRDPDSDFVVACTASAGPGGLLLTLDLPRTRDDRMVAVAVCLQDCRWEIFLNCRVRDRFTDYSIARSAERDVVLRTSSGPGNDVVELGLPPPVVESCTTDGVVHGLVVVREQVREWARMTAGAAVPLRIQVLA